MAYLETIQEPIKCKKCNTLFEYEKESVFTKSKIKIFIDHGVYPILLNGDVFCNICLKPEPPNLLDYDTKTQRHYKWYWNFIIYNTSKF